MTPHLRYPPSKNRLMPTPVNKPDGGLFYGWWLVGLSGFVMMLAHVPLFHAMSVWAVALEREFGWSRTQLGLALTFTRIEGGLMGPVEGYLTDRLGARRMVFFGLFLLSVGFFFFSKVESLWMFYTAYLIMAFGQGFCGWLPVMTLLNHWFVRQRTTAIGWANTGTRLGGLVIVPLIAWAIDPDYDRIGWRTTALVLSVITILVAYPISCLIQNRPEDTGLLPDGDNPRPKTDGKAASLEGEDETASRYEKPWYGSSLHADATNPPDLTAGEAVRTAAFWLISVGHGLTAMVILAIMAHVGLLLEDAGFSIQTTAWIVSAYTGVSMIFQLIGGYAGDRVSKRIALFVFSTLQALGVVVLTFATTSPSLLLFAVLFGAGFGGRNPLTIAIRGDYFGQASFGKILGLSTVPMNLFMILAPPFAGWMRDVQGDYILAFWILAGCSFAGGVCFLCARKPTRTVS